MKNWRLCLILLLFLSFTACKQDTHQAVLDLQHHLERFPDDMSVRQQLADTLFTSADYRIALLQYDTLVKASFALEDTLPKWFTCQLALGLYGNIVDAAARHDLAHVSKMSQARIHHTLATAYLRRLDWQSAEKHLMLAKSLGNIDTTLLEAELALKQKDLNQAEKLLTIAPAAESLLEYEALLAALAFEKKMYPLAVTRYHHLLAQLATSDKLYQENLIPYFLSLLKAEQPDTLAHYLKKQRKYLPEGLYHFGQGVLFLHQKQWIEAQNALLNAQKSLPIPQIEYFIAYLHWQLGNTAQAFTALDRYVFAGQNLELANQLRAVIQLDVLLKEAQSTDTLSATSIQMISDLLQQSPDKAWGRLAVLPAQQRAIWLSQTVSWLSEKKQLKVILPLVQRVLQSPSDRLIQLVCAEVYVKLGDYATARSVYHAILAVDPTNAIVINNLHWLDEQGIPL